MAFDWRLGLSTLASLAPQLEASRVAKRKQADLEAGQAAASAKQREADDVVAGVVGQMGKSTPREEHAQSMADYTTALRRSREEPASSVPTGLGGERFRADTQKAATQVGQYGQSQANLVSQIDAPQRQREGEGYAANRANVSLDRLGSGARTDQFLAQLRAQRQTENPWVALMSQLAQSIARNYTSDTLDPEAATMVVPGAPQPGPYRPQPQQNWWDPKPSRFPRR